MCISKSKVTIGIRLSIVLVFSVVLLCSSKHTSAQAWSGILIPNSSCVINTSVPGKCAIDWSTAGIPGGIPSGSWTQSGSTIQAATCSNGASDCTNTIQTALNACSGNKYVLLGAGTFLLNGNLTIGGGCALRGAGANLTILNSRSASGTPPISLGAGSPSYSGATAITSGGAAGSTSIVVANPAGITVGSYLVIDQQNDGTIVTINGSEGTCTFCDAGQGSGVYAQGQIVEVENVSGTTITISPALYVAYTRSPLAIPFTATKYAGVEALQVYANNTGAGTNFSLNQCAYCWVDGSEGNYTDADQVDIYWGYHDQVTNNYFSNSFDHTSGSYDANIFLGNKTSASLIQNNILERLHTSIMLNWGAAGNVVAYNDMFGNFDCNGTATCTGGATYFTSVGLSMHGAHPMFNLVEGNIDMSQGPDSIWGSNANNTLFRNWVLGTSLMCLPGNRGPVTCSPIGTPQGIASVSVSGTGTGYTSTCTITGSSGSGAACTANVNAGNVTSITINSPGSGYSGTIGVAVSGGSGQTFTPVINNAWYTPEGVASLNLGAFSTGFNSVGNIYGSQIIATMHEYDDPGSPLLTLTPLVVSVCGNPPCGVNSRQLFNAQGYNMAIGYGGTTDGGNGAGDTLIPYITLLSHGDYTSANNTVNWASGITHTLPPSFYLSSSKPSWWGSLPYPAQGPDLTGGNSNSFGYSYGNPAQACYQGVMGGTNGSASPLTFNAASCYASGGTQTKPAPATSLNTVVIH